MDSAKALGVAIDAERVACQLTKEELADESGVAPASLFAYLRGDREPPLNKLRQIAAALGERPQDLLDRADDVAGRADTRARNRQTNTGDVNATTN